MGNRFGLHGLEAASAHSERDVSAGRISNRPIEVPVTDSRSDFGSSCLDPEVSQTKIVPRYNGAQRGAEKAKMEVFSVAPKILGQGERWSSRLRRGIAASFVYPKTSEWLK